ncbi:hypothetical protein [Curtobacterium sp. MCPF17_031]|uniref:hypothetical protein n=1 Tax=Curtobacterium sp. MCPF17_031 TaxID=2175653 RepID=UPI000DAA00EA|nr:hypothetical protein [Curtobacterium sp. MCPF17_031]PZE33902.1 hypothetical protein DEJ31_15780 [Curtobacterium sp. MCPF17_031]
MRLPQDVLPEEQRGRLQPELLDGDVATYAAAHLAATRSGDFEARARALWGLVQNGSASLGWVAAGLAQHNTDAVADALGVLDKIGVPGTWLPMLSNLADQIPEGEARNVLDEMLPRHAGETTSEALPINPGLLFDGRLDAFTRSIAFIEAPLAEVEAAYRSWARYIEEHGNGKRLFRPVSGSVDVALGQLEPVTYPGGDALLLETGSRWTAAFSRSGDILFAQTLGNLMQRRNVRTSFSPHVRREGRPVRYGNRAFALADGRGQLRSLQASFQSRWQWNATGESLPFERSDAVMAERIPDRLTLDDINAYCEHLGIQRNEPSFYGPSGFLVEDDRSDWNGELRTMTSAEWLVDHS